MTKKAPKKTCSTRPKHGGEVIEPVTRKCGGASRRIFELAESEEIYPDVSRG